MQDTKAHETCVSCLGPTVTGLALLGGLPEQVAGLVQLGVPPEVAAGMLASAANPDLAIGVLVCSICAANAGMSVAEVTAEGVDGVPNFWPPSQPERKSQ